MNLLFLLSTCVLLACGDVMVMAYAYEMSCSCARGCGMSYVYMLKSVGERTPH